MGIGAQAALCEETHERMVGVITAELFWSYRLVSVAGMPSPPPHVSADKVQSA